MTNIILIDWDIEYRNKLSEYLKTFADFNIVGQASRISDAKTAAGDQMVHIVVTNLDFGECEDDALSGASYLKTIFPGCRILICAELPRASRVRSPMMDNISGFRLKTEPLPEIRGAINALALFTGGESFCRAILELSPYSAALPSTYKRRRRKYRNAQSRMDEIG